MGDQCCGRAMINQARGITRSGKPTCGGTTLTTVIVLISIMLFLMRGLLHLLVVPMWEGFDEPFHYAYLQYIAERGRLPPLNTPSVSQEVLESLQLFPTTPHLSNLSSIRFKDFWGLPASDQLRLRQSLNSIDPASKYRLTDLANYETQQPPLYYLLCVPVYQAARHLPLVERVSLLRMVSVLLAAASLPLGYLLARQVFTKSWATLVPVLMALFPNYYVFVARVTNDALAVVILSLLILATGRLQKSITPVKSLSVGCLLGLGLLTKVYFLTAVPVPLVMILLRRRRGKISSRTCALALILVLVPTALLAGWWYLRNYLEVGAFSGLAEMRIASLLPLIAWINALPHLRLGQFGKLLFELHLWAGNWSFRTVSKTFYQLFEVVYALCGVGIIRLLLRNRSMLEQESDQNRESRTYLTTSIGFFLSFLAGIFYHRWSATVAGLFVDRQWFGAIGSEGWYLNALLPVEAILLFLGIQGLVAIRGARVASLTLLGLFFALDQVALWNREIPYYAGLSIRVAHPSANPVDAVKHVTASLALAFRRVAFLGPHWSSDSLLLALIITTLCIAAVTFVLVYCCLRRSIVCRV